MLAGDTRTLQSSSCASIGPSLRSTSLDRRSGGAVDNVLSDKTGDRLGLSRLLSMIPRVTDGVPIEHGAGCDKQRRKDDRVVPVGETEKGAADPIGDKA